MVGLAVRAPGSLVETIYRRVLPSAGTRSPSRSAAQSDPRADTERLFEFALLLFAIGCWLFTRHHTGVSGDARIYIGRALADLAPTTIGRDVMFAHDGQAQFSLFTVVIRDLVGRFGVAQASLGVGFAGMGLWFAAFAALAYRLAPGRLAWAMLMFVAVLPSTYGDCSIMYGEAIAVPRPFAEAGVLAAFAAMMDGRRLLAMGLLVVAALVHPIMALCGLGVVLVVMIWENPRWLAAVAGLLALVIIAAIAGAPVFNRLFHPVDPQWLDLLHQRNSYLFPALWSGKTWGRAVVQLSTAGIGGSLLVGRARRLFGSAVIVGVAGVALTFVMGDLYPSLLVLQLQPWRALWLVGVLAAAGGAVCGVKLWREGPVGHVTLALLAIGWLTIDSPIAIVPALFAVGVRLGDARQGGAPITSLGARAAWIVLAVFVACDVVQEARLLAVGFQIWPATFDRFDVTLRSFNFKMLAVAPLVVWAVIAQVKSAGRTVSWSLTAAALGFVALALVHWPQVAPYAVRGGGPDRDLVAMLNSRPGEVMWLNSDIQPWTLAGRANWGSEVQGGSIVFSRPAALAWRTRMNQLLAHGLVLKNIFTPWDGSNASDASAPTVGALSSLCSLPQGPAWIVDPLLKGEAAPDMPGVRIWRAPYAAYVRKLGKTPAWFPITGYAVVPCGTEPVLRPPQPI